MAATLPKDLLILILAELNVDDQARFSSVCKWWRLVVAENPGMNKPFILVHCTDPEFAISQIIDSFFGTSWLEAKFIGSCEGWLVCWILHRGVFLVNISASFSIRLPDSIWDTLMWACSSRCQCAASHIHQFAALSGSQGAASQIHPFAARKVVLSSTPSNPDKCVIVRLDNFCDLSLCRLGDTDWTKFYGEQSITPGLIDIIYLKNHLYCISCDGKLQVFDSGLSSTQTVCNFPRLDSYTYLAKSSSDDRLFVIVMKNEVFKVFEIDPKNSSYTEVEGLEDTKLFLVRPCSLALSAIDCPEFPPNHIYEVSYENYGFPHKGVFTDYYLDSKKLEVGSGYRIKCPVFFTLFRRSGFINECLRKDNDRASEKKLLSKDKGFWLRRLINFDFLSHKFCG